MQMHQMPPDTRDKERIFGGVLTLIQAVFLGIGFIIGLLLFGFFQFLIGWLPLSVIGFLSGLVIGAFFALYKKHDLMVHTYILRKRKFDKKTKHLKNINVRSSESKIKKLCLMTQKEVEKQLEEGGK